MNHEILENQLSNIIIGLAIKVHKILGPGLLEKIYRDCLFYELKDYGFKVEKEKSLPVEYDDLNFDTGFRIDILVEDKVVVEVKAVQKVLEVHKATTKTYCKLTDCKLGLVINFNCRRLKEEGIHRVVNGIED